MAQYFAWLTRGGQYVRVSQEYADLLNRSVDQIEGTYFGALHPHQDDAFQAAVARLAKEPSLQWMLKGSSDWPCHLLAVPDSDLCLLTLDDLPSVPDLLMADSDEDPVPRLKSVLNRRLAKAKSKQEHLALIKISLDRFDWLSETLGEQAAEALVADVGERLTSALRRHDTLFRIREDRFLILVESIGQEEEVLKIAHRLNDLLSFGVRVDRREVHLNIAMGVALAPSQANDAAELIGAASQALKAAQRNTSDRVRLYDPIRQRKALNLEALTHLVAPDYNDLSLSFRPIYGVTSHRIEAAHLVPVFKGVACEAGDEHTLMHFFDHEGGWQMYLGWLLNALELPLSKLSEQKSFQGLVIRIDPQVLELPGFIDFLSDTCRIKDEYKPYLMWEVDAIETRDHEGALFDLEALGYRVVVSGLGEYSPPLQQLKELEPHWLKLDQAWVQSASVDSQKRRMLEQLADMAADLEIPMVADGVRTGGIRLQLSQQGVKYMQGDYFGGLLSLEMLNEQLILENII
jgi:diguanylate cyclase (GGDEF)-like protein